MLDFSPLGDRAVTIRLGATIDEATNRLVRAACARLDEGRPPGVVEYVPGYASVTVHYDPARVPRAPDDAGSPPYARLVVALARALAQLAPDTLPSSRVVEIPVCYGGADGPDVEEVGRRNALSADEVVRLHAGADYLVYMLGFAPGFPYLGGLPERLTTPRRAVPRTLVPAGSVGIGGSQTGIYSIASPGGWQIIGRTPLRLFDTLREPPTLLRAGDRVRFRPISRAELEQIEHDAEPAA